MGLYVDEPLSIPYWFRIHYRSLETECLSTKRPKYYGDDTKKMEPFWLARHMRENAVDWKTINLVRGDKSLKVITGRGSQPTEILVFRWPRLKSNFWNPLILIRKHNDPSFKVGEWIFLPGSDNLQFWDWLRGLNIVYSRSHANIWWQWYPYQIDH